MINIYNTELGQCVSILEIYDYLELNKSQYARFVKYSVKENDFMKEGIDYSACPIKKKTRGNYASDYHIHINAAIKILRRVKSVKAVDLYKYLNEQISDKEIIIQYNRIELEFGNILYKLYDGILKIEKQYRILNYRLDFFIHEFDIAIEIDEHHHSDQKCTDYNRQIEIEKVFLDRNKDLKFLRVKEGNIIDGIKRVNECILYYSNSNLVCTHPRLDNIMF